MTLSDLELMLPFYKQLSPHQIDMILQTAQEKRFEAGNIIVSGGGSCQGFIVVKNGLIGASMVSEDGREAELFELNNGQMCIMSASCIFLPKTFHVQMAAEKESDVIIIPSSTVEKLQEENIYVELFAYKTMTARFVNVMQAVEELLFVPVDKRLAKMLLKIQKSEIHTTQDALAKKLGTAREVVSRTLSSFKERGILEVKRGQIRLIKPSLLKELVLK